MPWRDVWRVPHDEPFALVASFYGPRRPFAEALRAAERATGAAARALWVLQVAPSVDLPTLVESLARVRRPQLLVCAVEPTWRRAQGSLSRSELWAALRAGDGLALVEGSPRAAVVGTLELATPGDGVTIVAPRSRRDAVVHDVVEGLRHRARPQPRRESA